MKKSEIVGIRGPVDRTVKTTGQVVKAYNLSFVSQDPNYNGYKAEDIFIDERYLDGYIPKVGDIVTVLYGQAVTYNGRTFSPIEGLIHHSNEK